MSTAAVAASPAEEPRSPAVLTPVDEVATRVRTRADALTPAEGLRITRTAVSQIATPPDIWSDDRPSLRKLWLYSRYGQWTGPATLGRVLATVYTICVAFPLTSLGYLALWIVERPARLIIAALLGALTYLAF
jgi:hypothetical protein